MGLIERIGLNTTRNIATGVVAVLAASNIPMLRNALASILNMPVPIPLVDNVAGIFGVLGLFVVYLMWDKTF